MTNQQAINLLKGLEQRLDDYCELNDEGKTTFRMAIESLELFGNSEHLTSAQPEIIRCKDCKYSDENWRRVSVRWLPCMDIRVPSNWFCGSAERREE